ncbi:arginine--tRNA ligase [Candidatus Kaiserbacteria bacterium CG10_big_fil_rev_8_21_14_0_10_56_12]|uniref:Arginine--tRNA ligase n=1 Tax=Candidatus Kaiserbacteria bacterium CG10_big_fil_rev_8_21_14_0_10_56_12 TaxID=1974611 RepID=A0A2H0U9R4_9BACT|nr:MAG: arginine--tRNA ligase [Candidatus Kaiserbacteria bacterium CG10_big_fil_rev_8_21_14_0_10_56_12]
MSDKLSLMEDRIRSSIGHGIAVAGGGSSIVAIIRRPPNLSLGDYAVYIGAEFAESVAIAVREELGNLAVKVEVAKGGFINITLSRAGVALAIAEAIAQGEDWGRGSHEEGQRVMVEYSNPNAFKEMHVGHLVGTIVGEALSRLIENSDATIARDTFGGDIGPNVAKALWGLRKNGITEPTTAKEIGEAYVTGSGAYEGGPHVQAEIDALNQAIYGGTDAELMALWRKGREVSVEEFRRIWALLGTHFDYEFFDSDTTEIGLRVVHDGLAKGVFERSDGAVIYNGEKHGVHTMVFVTSHHTPTYETKDIGLAFLKEERWPSDKVIIVTGNEQTGRFKTVLAALGELAPLLAEKTTHVATGFLKLSSGKMSSREGNVITAAEFIDNVIQRASEKNEDPLIAEQVAVGAIKYMVLRQAPGSDIIFDTEKSLSLEGDSGPYLQYALVRAKKILTYATNGEKGSNEPSEPYAIERVILHYPEVAARSARELAPNLLLTYLTELAAAWNAFYASEQVLGSPEEAYKQRVAQAFANTMTNGLTLLGIPTPEQM